jgi:transposase
VPRQIALGLVGAQVGQPDTPVGARSTAGDLPFVQQSNEVRPRHAKDRRCLVRGQNLVFRHENDGLLVLHGLKDECEQIGHGRGQGDLVAGRTDQRCGSSLRHELGHPAQIGVVQEFRENPPLEGVLYMTIHPEYGTILVQTKDGASMRRLHLEPWLSAAELRARAEACTSPREALRWLTLSRVAAGATATALAVELGVDEKSIRNWVRRYNEGGSETTLADSRGRRPGERLLSAEQREVLSNLLAGSAPDGGAWTDGHVAELLSEWLGRPMPPSLARGYLPPAPRQSRQVIRASGGPRRFQPQAANVLVEVGRVPYPSDLTDAEWAQVADLVEQAVDPAQTGRRCEWSKREILDAIFYEVRSGCAWRMLPHDLPPWKTVYHYFRQWRRDGTWERLNQVLRERVRERTGREPEPSAAVLDSQSAKTSEKGGRGATTGAKR